MQGCYDREYWIVITILCKITERRIVEMIQSGWVGRQNGRKLWSRGGCIYKIEIPIFSVFFLRYSVFFSIWNTDFGIGIGILKYLGIRYRYRLPTQDYTCQDRDVELSSPRRDRDIRKISRDGLKTEDVRVSVSRPSGDVFWYVSVSTTSLLNYH